MTQIQVPYRLDTVKSIISFPVETGIISNEVNSALSYITRDERVKFVNDLITPLYDTISKNISPTKSSKFIKFWNISIPRDAAVRLLYQIKHLKHCLKSSQEMQVRKFAIRDVALGLRAYGLETADDFLSYSWDFIKQQPSRKTDNEEKNRWINEMKKNTLMNILTKYFNNFLPPNLIKDYIAYFEKEIWTAYSGYVVDSRSSQLPETFLNYNKKIEPSEKEKCKQWLRYLFQWYRNYNYLSHNVRNEMQNAWETYMTYKVDVTSLSSFHFFYCIMLPILDDFACISILDRHYNSLFRAWRVLHTIIPSKDATTPNTVSESRFRDLIMQIESYYNMMRLDQTSIEKKFRIIDQNSIHVEINSYVTFKYENQNGNDDENAAEMEMNVDDVGNDVAAADPAAPPVDDNDDDEDSEQIIHVIHDSFYQIYYFLIGKGQITLEESIKLLSKKSCPFNFTILHDIAILFGLSCERYRSFLFSIPLLSRMLATKINSEDNDPPTTYDSYKFMSFWGKVLNEPVCHILNEVQIIVLLKNILRQYFDLFWGKNYHENEDISFFCNGGDCYLIATLLSRSILNDERALTHLIDMFKEESNRKFADGVTRYITKDMQNYEIVDHLTDIILFRLKATYIHTLNTYVRETTYLPEKLDSSASEDNVNHSVEVALNNVLLLSVDDAQNEERSILTYMNNTVSDDMMKLLFPERMRNLSNIFLNILLTKLIEDKYVPSGDLVSEFTNMVLNYPVSSHVMFDKIFYELMAISSCPLLTDMVTKLEGDTIDYMLILELGMIRFALSCEHDNALSSKVMTESLKLHFSQICAFPPPCERFYNILLMYDRFGLVNIFNQEIDAFFLALRTVVLTYFDVSILLEVQKIQVKSKLGRNGHRELNDEYKVHNYSKAYASTKSFLTNINLLRNGGDDFVKECVSSASMKVFGILNTFNCIPEIVNIDISEYENTSNTLMVNGTRSSPQIFEAFLQKISVILLTQIEKLNVKDRTRNKHYLNQLKSSYFQIENKLKPIATNVDNCRLISMSDLLYIAQINRLVNFVRDEYHLFQ